MEEKKTVEETVEVPNVPEEKQSFGQKVKEVGKAIAEVLVKNPVMIIPVVSGVLGIVGKVASIAMGGGHNWNEHYLSEDDVTGEEFRLRHPMTNSEILELGDRMIDGQSKGDALEDMGLLRNERRRKG